MQEELRESEERRREAERELETVAPRVIASRNPIRRTEGRITMVT